MDETILLPDEELKRREAPKGEPQPIGDVLTELFARYQARYPGLQINVVHTAVEAA